MMRADRRGAWGSAPSSAQGSGLSSAAIFLSFLLLVAGGASADGTSSPGFCVMRGSCVPHKVCRSSPSSAPGQEDCPFPGDGAPCLLPSGTPPVKAESIAPSIEEVCGGVFARNDSVCCDDDQLSILKKQLTMAQGLLGSCPACWQNFKAFWCTFTCSPSQSTFLDVTQSSVCSSKDFPGPNAQGQAGCAGSKSDLQKIAAVQSVQVAIDEGYADNLFGSCKDLTVSATGQKAMMMAFGGSKTAADFLEFQGHEAYDSGQNPMDIKFHMISNMTSSPRMESSIISCQTEDPEFACLCSDCNQACASPPGHVHDKPIWHAEAGSATFNVLLLFAAAFVIDIYLLALASLQIEGESNAKAIPDTDPGDEEALPDSNGNRGVTETESDRQPLIHSEPETLVQSGLAKLGDIVSEHPIWIVWFWVLATILFGCLLWVRPLQVLTDPVKLWAQKGSRALEERQFFNDHFGPFWRTEMIIVKPKPHATKFDALMSTMRLQLQLEGLNVSCNDTIGVTEDQACDHTSETWSLNQLCFQPTPGAGCLVESPTEYWQMNSTRLLETPGCAEPQTIQSGCEMHVKDKLDLCATKGASRVECWTRAKVPLSEPKILFGSEKEGVKASESDAFIVTYLLENDPWTAPRAAAWERKVISLLQAYNDSAVTISFSTETSLELELARGGNADVSTIAVSYLVMLLYVSCSLGRSKGRTMERRLMLACTGVTIVGMSLIISASVCALLGIQATLIMSEVIPFLVLAIGVDNIFILVWAFDATDGQDSLLQSRCSIALQKVGPSIICAAVAESVAFLLGSDTGMPAVVAFAQFAAVSVCIGGLMQLSLFVAVLAVVEQGASSIGQTGLQANLLESRNGVGDGQNAMADAEQQENQQEGVVQHISLNFFEGRARVVILTVAGAGVLAAIFLSCFVSLGLDQNEALPKDSYLVDYFADEFKLVQVGAPVFFIVKNGIYSNKTGPASSVEGDRIHFGDIDTIQKLCSRPGCRKDSLGNSVANIARFENYTYIATGSSNWANDYLSWLMNSLSDPSQACCRYRLTKENQRGAMCPPYWTPELHPGKKIDPSCACNKTLTYKSPACPSAPAEPCEVAGGCLSPDLPYSAFMKYNKSSGAGKCWGVRLSGLCPQGGESPFCSKDCYAKYGNYERTCLPPGTSFPSESDVSTFFPDFLSSECPSDPSDAFCSVCGLHYLSDLADISLTAASLHGHPVPSTLVPKIDEVVAVRHMAYHSRLSKQEDFIGALRYAYAIAGNLSSTLELEVSVYSIFYVFFEQYLTIEWATMKVSVLSHLAVFLVVLCTLGSPTSAGLVLITAIAIEVVLIGVMGAWSISLNALSAVNLVAAIGISVEFSVHIVHSFQASAGTRSERAREALQGVGTAVFTGIAMTKLLGVAVLAFSHSQIFITYYFRMYFSLVLAGSLYGLIVLPVLLSVFGPIPEKDEAYPPAIYSVTGNEDSQLESQQ